MNARVGDILVHYEIAGSGEPLVLAHGAGHSLDCWRRQVPAFARHYRVLTYDIRGHGGTEAGKTEASEETWARDLSRLLKALNLRPVYLLGHSMGAGIATALATAHPGLVKALVISNSYRVAPLTGAEIEQANESLKAALATLDRAGMAGVAEGRLITYFSPSFAQRNPALAREYKDMVLKTSADNFRNIISAALRRKAPDYGKLTCPTLIIAGEYEGDRVIAAAGRLQRMIPGSELKVFPTGHHPFLEQPEAYNAAVLDFLAGVE